MLGFTAALAVATCLLFGLMPALRATCLEPSSAMRAGGRSVTGGRGRLGLRPVLVTAQVALSLILLFGALLFVRSLHNLLTVEMGFRPERILSVDVDFGSIPYPKERRLAVYRELSGRLAAVPGVASVAQVSFTPIAGGTWDNLVAPDAASAAAGGRSSFFNVASPGYFRTMGTPLEAGREFDSRDTLTSPRVAIVNEMFARRVFGGANPVGRTFHMAAEAGRPEPSYQIIGLVRNTKYAELREEFKPIVFFCVAQDDDPRPSAAFVLRLAGSPGSVMNDAKAAVQAMNSSMGIRFRLLSAQLEESLLRERLMATLSGGFGFLAGLLAMLGLHGVIAYMVARRRKEIGVRIALGADPTSVVRLVLREALLPLGFGLAIGVVMARWAGQGAATLLFGLQPYDAVSLMTAGALLTAIALIASYVPARRAAALDPITTLRNE
jgi:putative ABC transport system permease protein